MFSAPGLLGNDSFGVTIVSSDTSATAGGVVTVNADGSWSVTSAAGFVGNTTFTYPIDDGTGAQDTATVYLTYEAPSPPPTTIDALDDYYTNLLNNQEYYFDVPGLLGNDTSGATIVASDISTVFDGSGYVNSDGGWFVPSANGFVGTISFTYTVDDGMGTQDTATVYLTYEAPLVVDAVDDYRTLRNDQAYSFDAPGLLENDSSGSTIVASDISTVFDGTGYVNGDGGWSIPFANGFLGTVSFSYTIDDGTGTQDTATVYLTYEAPVVNCAVQTEIPESECDALVNLYNSTNGASWTNNTGWTVTNSPCSWYGISCVGEQFTLFHVATIALVGNNLNGTIPPLPPSLQILDLSKNSLTEAIPVLPATLTTINLANNQLKGAIPVFPPSLTYANLSFNQLKGSIPSLPSPMYYIELWGNQLSGTIPELPAALRGFLAPFNQLTGPIPSLPEGIITFAVSDNDLSGPIPTLPASLQDFSASNNALTSTIPQLPSVLYLLWLDGNNLSGELPISLANTAIDRPSRLRLCGGANDLYSNNPAVNAFVEALKPGWSPNNSCTTNLPPTANAGADKSVTDSDNSGSESVTLNGSLSSDADGTITAFSWSENGSEIATGVTLSVNLSVGVHTITLTVTDNRGGTATDTVTIEVTIPPNVLPTANAGADQSVTDSNNSGSESVILNGSLSSDPDGTITSYSWSKNGSEIAIGAAPSVNLAVGRHVLTLTVTDNRGGTATDRVTIEVSVIIGCAYQTQIPESECNDLVNLYNSTNGAGWNNKTRWLATNTPCSWYGIACADGHVVDISLSLNNLTGSLTALPPSLKYFDVQVNRLSGNIPTLPLSLINFQAANNLLRGSIPALPSTLGSLSIHKNLLTGTIPTLPSSLRSFEASDNQLRGSIPALPSTLVFLHLYNNQLRGSIPALPSTLGSLFLYNNQLSGSIPALPQQIVYLDVSYNQLTGAVPTAITMTNVFTLTLCGGANDLYSNDPTVNAFIAARIPSWSPNNGCFANQAPTVNAGADQSVTDSNNSGSESVALNGSLSSDADGMIASYSWSENGSKIAPGVISSVNLAVGTHVITLTVTDNRGGTATDTVTITVLAAPPNNTAPRVTIYIPEVVVTRGSISFNIGDYSDPDRDTVRLTASVGSIAKTGPSQGLWLWSYDVPRSTPRGTVITVTITATDTRGAVTTQSFRVRVR